MPRLFGVKKDSKGGQVKVIVSEPKKRFKLFRRGGHSESNKCLESSEEPTTPNQTNQSYRIAVYETRANSPTPTCGSTDGSDDEHLETGPGTTGSSRPSQSPQRFRAQIIPASSKNSHYLTHCQISRTLTTTTTTTDSITGTGILKTGILNPRSNSPVSPFELEIMRNGTSLTDEMSTASSEDLDAELPKEHNHGGHNTRCSTRSGIGGRTKGVSFSKDVRDPPPKAAAGSQMITCLPAAASRNRKLKRRTSGADFSLTQEVGELCYDVTYFFRCFNEQPQQNLSENSVQTIPDDEQTNDSSMLDRSSSLASASLEQSRGSI
jgi:hypothetical protein